MDNIKTKAYIINLKYGIWENQLWLEAADNGEKALEWERAKDGLDGVAAQSVNAADYFSKAVAHFASYGFMRIQK